MKFKVYHTKDWSLNSALHFVDNKEICEKNYPYWLGGYKPFRFDYKHVATVECDSLGDVFRLTNHIDCEWWLNDEVIFHVDKSRSTSVGDLIEDEDGNLIMVAGIGFEDVEWYMGAFKKVVGRGGNGFYHAPLTSADVKSLNIYQMLVNEAAEMDEIDDFTKGLICAAKRGLKKIGIEV